MALCLKNQKCYIFLNIWQMYRNNNSLYSSMINVYTMKCGWNDMKTGRSSVYKIFTPEILQSAPNDPKLIRNNQQESVVLNLTLELWDFFRSIITISHFRDVSNLIISHCLQYWNFKCYIVNLVKKSNRLNSGMVANVLIILAEIGRKLQEEYICRVLKYSLLTKAKTTRSPWTLTVCLTTWHITKKKTHETQNFNSFCVAGQFQRRTPNNSNWSQPISHDFLLTPMLKSVILLNLANCEET